MKKSLLEQIKKSIVFIGMFKKNRKGKLRSVLIGTGSLMNIQGTLHLLTAKHITCEVNDKGKILREREDLHFFVNGKKNGEKTVIATPLKLLKKKKINWCFHPNPAVDIAVLPFMIDQKIMDIKTLPTSLFLDIKEIYETNEIFFLSYQPNISNIEKDNIISPIVRKGMVSRVNIDETFYIDGFAFPGNSGSPVYMLPAAARFTETGIKIGGDKLGGKFLGIIGEYIPYEEVAVSIQTKRPRIIFEENTGLSKVWSTSYVVEIFQSRAFKDNIKALKKID